MPVDWENTEAHFVTIGNEGFTTEGVDEPGKKVFVALPVPAGVFHKESAYEYSSHPPFSHGRTLWEGAMQSRIAEEVLIISDGLDSGLFCCANFQNDNKYPFIFAKLVQCPLYDKIVEVFTRKMR